MAWFWRNRAQSVIVNNLIIIDNKVHGNLQRKSLFAAFVAFVTDKLDNKTYENLQKEEEKREIVVCKKLPDGELERAFVRREEGIEYLDNLFNYIQGKVDQDYEINILYIHIRVLDNIEVAIERIHITESLLEKFPNIKIRLHSGRGLSDILKPLRDRNGERVDIERIHIIIESLLEKFPNIKIRLHSGRGLSDILDPLRDRNGEKRVDEEGIDTIAREFQKKHWQPCDDEGLLTILCNFIFNVKKGISVPKSGISLSNEERTVLYDRDLKEFNKRLIYISYFFLPFWLIEEERKIDDDTILKGKEFIDMEWKFLSIYRSCNERDRLEGKPDEESAYTRLEELKKVFMGDFNRTSFREKYQAFCEALPRRGLNESKE